MLNLIVQYNKREKEEGETALGLDGEKVFSPGEAVTQRTERSRLMVDPMLVVYR